MGTSVRVAIVCVGLGVAGGGVLVHALDARRVPSPSKNLEAQPEPPPVVREVMAVPTSVKWSPEDRESLRALIRDEVRAARAHEPQPDPGASAAPKDALSALAPEAVDAYDRARSRIADAIQRQSWSEADRAKFREDAASLPQDVTMDLTKQLIVAVNTGKVHYEARGPLF